MLFRSSGLTLIILISFRQDLSCVIYTLDCLVAWLLGLLSYQPHQITSLSITKYTHLPKKPGI
nr:MAG TPA_asm: hypothetical protein [Caudoviricetes sp.]